MIMASDQITATDTTPNITAAHLDKSGIPSNSNHRANRFHIESPFRCGIEGAGDRSWSDTSASRECSGSEHRECEYSRDRTSMSFCSRCSQYRMSDIVFLTMASVRSSSNSQILNSIWIWTTCLRLKSVPESMMLSTSSNVTSGCWILRDSQQPHSPQPAHSLTAPNLLAPSIFKLSSVGINASMAANS